jgi:hypothetical protein
MNPSAAYRKSDRGVAEISGGQRTLTPRLRQALIMVNGKLTGAQLAAMLGGAAAGMALVDELEQGGYIEAVGTATAPTTRPMSLEDLDTTPFGRGGPPSVPADGVAQAPLDPKKLQNAQRTATRLLTDVMGPAADDLATRIERAKTREEMERLLTLATNTVREMAGRTRSEAFRAQVFALLE